MQSQRALSCREWALLIALLVAVSLLAALPVAAFAGPVAQADHTIRLRVIANSDSPADQAVKRAVRDAVVSQFAAVLSGVTTPAQAQHRIGAALPAILDTARAAARAAGSQDPVTARFGREHFPTKAYGELLFPAGTYEALVIGIGAAQGHNWWGIVFPPLAFVGAGPDWSVVETDDRDPLQQLTPSQESALWAALGGRKGSDQAVQAFRLRGDRALLLVDDGGLQRPRVTVRFAVADWLAQWLAALTSTEVSAATR